MLIGGDNISDDVITLGNYSAARAAPEGFHAG